MLSRNLADILDNSHKVVRLLILSFGAFVNFGFFGVVDGRHLHVIVWIIGPNPLNRSNINGATTIKSVTISNMPWLPRKTVNFYSITVFDWAGMQFALERNKDKGKVVAGSTISQQLAKNLFLYNKRSFLRKGQEAVATWMMERVWTNNVFWKCI